MVRRRRPFSFLLAILLLTVPASSRAQDDWGLIRERGGGGSTTTRPRGGGGARRPRAEPRTPEVAPPSDRSAVMLERYLRVLESEPSDGFALDRLIELHRERDGNDRALRELLEARATGENGWWARMLLGHLARRAHRLDEARAQYEQAATLRPDEPLATIAIARVLRESGDTEGARTRYEAALERTPRGPARDDVTRELATLALDRGDVDEARRRFDQLAGGAGGSLYLRTELARALLARGDHERAIAEYERVAGGLRGDARASAPVLIELARAQLGAGRDADAIATLDRAVASAGGASGTRAEADELRLEAYRRADRLDELATSLARRSGPEAAALLGRVHDELGHDGEALDAYRRALRARPRDVDLRLRIVQVLARAGRIDELIEEYRALVRSAPDEPRHVVQLAELLRETGRRDEALATLEAASRRSRDPALHQRLAELYARWGERQRAEAELAALVRLDPSDALHLIALGSQQFDAGDREGAMTTWRRILTLGGDRADAHATLGGILADHDLLSDAIDEHTEAARLAPDRLEIVRGLATTLERAGRDAEALPHWQRVLALAGDDRAARREARERIVGLWVRTRQVDAMAQSLGRAFQGDPPDLEAGRMLAEIHRRRRDLEGSQRVLARLAELEPGDIETLTALERVRSQAGDRAGAIEVLRRLVEIDPRRAATHLSRMAEHALALYRDDDARAYAAEAVELSPEDASAHRRLGDLLRAGQDVDGAIASYRRALERDPRLFDTAFDLAEMHLARGEHEDADRVYRDVLARAPDDDLVARAARASLQIHVGVGTLEALERELLPLALAHPERPIYRRVVVELYDAMTGPLVVRARRSGPEGDEARASLRRWGARAIKPLLEALADADPSQRRIALAILGPLGNPAAAAPLLGVAETAESLDVRVQALLGVAAIPSAALVPRLATLATAEAPAIRAAATLALARTGGRAAIEVLRARLADDDSQVRGWAALGLGATRDVASAPALRRIVEDPRQPRASAALALGWLGDRDAIAPLVALAREAHPGVAPAALAALAAHDTPVARAARVTALFPGDGRVRRAAAASLRTSARAPDALPLPAPGEGPADLALRLARADETLPPPDLDALAPTLVSVLREALSSGPAPRVAATLSVLAAGPAPLGLGELTRDLDTWPEAARASAARSLERLLAQLVPDLSTCARADDASVRAEAARVLAHADDTTAATVLADALDDGAATVRRAALDALAEAELDPTETLRARTASLLASSDDWAMRTRAARALGTLGGDAARAALITALRDDAFAFVREEAALALGRLGGEGADVALSDACARDDEPRVRAGAARAIEALGGSCDPRVR
ncbi:TPR repeat protein [Sandaracinus amylolyticus]|uniref:TPR repeat protein n=1 Tax=Sandaracinus amylolyticus TaxID=927083 RepID=A0A0F6YIY4_9BACT|nr:TPR repeat protein [Sandaracinus amylolyticus]